MLVIKQLIIATDLHRKKYVNVQSQWPSTVWLVVTNILQNIFFFVQQKNKLIQVWNYLRARK